MQFGDSMLIYGQPTGDNAYTIIDSPIFLYWAPALTMVGRIVRWQFPYDGGRKLHISASDDTAEATARAALPVLQRLNAKHKVVYPLDVYRRMNTAEQAGKFITIYSGRMMENFLTITRELEAVLGPMAANGAVRPGPLPRDRQSGHAQPERQLAGSRMISYVEVNNFRE